MSTPQPPHPSQIPEQRHQSLYIYILTLSQTTLLPDIDNIYTTKTLHATQDSALAAIGARVDAVTAQFGEGFQVDAATGLGYVVPGKVVLRIELADGGSTNESGDPLMPYQIPTEDIMEAATLLFEDHRINDTRFKEYIALYSSTSIHSIDQPPRKISAILKELRLTSD
ncbi:hypothetical protein MMC30_008094 [Trapelia coarctata]|nr:hypothetical protein [Trapelia coarctata]